MTKTKATAPQPNDARPVACLQSLRPRKVTYADVLAVAAQFRGRLRRDQDADQQRVWR